MHPGNDIKKFLAAPTWETSPKEGMKSFNFLQNSKFVDSHKFFLAQLLKCTQGCRKNYAGASERDNLRREKVFELIRKNCLDTIW